MVSILLSYIRTYQYEDVYLNINAANLNQKRNTFSNQYLLIQSILLKEKHSEKNLLIQSCWTFLLD